MLLNLLWETVLCIIREGYQKTFFGFRKKLSNLKNWDVFFCRLRDTPPPLFTILSNSKSMRKTLHLSTTKHSWYSSTIYPFFWKLIKILHLFTQLFVSASHFSHYENSHYLSDSPVHTEMCPLVSRFDYITGWAGAVLFVKEREQARQTKQSEQRCELSDHKADTSNVRYVQLTTYECRAHLVQQMRWMGCDWSTRQWEDIP
jgi:hypothetical protein